MTPGVIHKGRPHLGGRERSAKSGQKRTRGRGESAGGGRPLTHYIILRTFDGRNAPHESRIGVVT